MSEKVLVIGAILLDVKGKPLAGLEPNTSNPSTSRVTRGGTARNVAENLGLLGAEVTLLSAVGSDIIGQQLIGQTAAANVDIGLVQIIEGENTGAYIAVLEPDGSLSVALDDVSVIRHITPSFLNRHRALFRDSDMVMIDGSLSVEATKTAVRLATHYDIPLCADPSSARLTYKIRPYLSELHLIVPNEVEAASICQFSVLDQGPDGILHLAQMLVKEGVSNVVLTLKDFGLDYATADETGYIPPRYSDMVDSTGTGDAVTAAIMFGMLNGLSTIESIRLGAAAAGVTLETTETVAPNLSLDMLYHHLIV